MNPEIFKRKRKSYIEQSEIYFWTATINSWMHLLADDRYKQMIIDSRQYLTDLGKVDIFAFVIMPNHLHTIWRINEPNGKESPQGSFLKYTAHSFQELLRKENNPFLSKFRVNATNKSMSSGRPILSQCHYLHERSLFKS